jgi:predicted RNase H-like HicB family nuclease
MNKDVFDGFKVNVFLDEDGDYLAHFVEMPNVSAFSDTPEGALRELAIAWKGVKESYQKHHEPVPKAPTQREDGTPFKVSIDARLYRALTDEAAKAGVSLYALVAQKLKSTVLIDQEGVKR